MTGPLNVPPPEPRRWLRLLIALVVTAAAVFGGIWAYDKLFVECGEGVTKQGPHDECVGVSDGSFWFDNSLKDIAGKIRAENRRVRDSGKRWVSVAYVEPMTLGANDKGRDSIRQELEGAYLAQLELNDPESGGGYGDLPQIRLLLANSGTGSEQWEPLVNQLISMKNSEDQHLVAVAGFGQSLTTTESAIEALRTAEVPMVGSTVTADSLSREDVTGFVRVAPPNADEASAAVKYLKAKQAADPGYQVTTIKDRGEKDIYSTSLYGGFIAAATLNGLTVEDRGLNYLAGEGTANAFSSIANQVCQNGPDAIYFAGRGRDMRTFIEAMAGAGNRCPTTVFSGDDAVGILFDIVESTAEQKEFQEVWKSSNVTVLYTALAHPAEFKDGYPEDRSNPYVKFEKDYLKHVNHGADQLQNGQAIMGHDAVLTLGAAIREGAGPQGQNVVTTGVTRNMLLQFSSKPVIGVSGPIRFNDKGDPTDKPMALVELEPSGSYTFRKLVKP